MCRSKLKLLKLIFCLTLVFCSFKTSALEFEPGIGFGLEYTDNAALTPDNQLEDLILSSYVGALLNKDSGRVQTDIRALLSYLNYTQDSFEDQSFLELYAKAGWEMVENHFDWLLLNSYTQRLVNTLEPNIPTNLQNTNIFTFGASMGFPVSGRQVFTLIPEYRNYYYEIQATSNQQYSLDANWNYQMYRSTNVGLNASTRIIDYDVDEIDDVAFSSVYFSIAGSSARSEYSTNLGTTRVKRDGGQSTEEFSGNLNWLVDLTKYSTIRTYIATGLTDSSTGTLDATLDPGTGDPVNIQATTDVIRNQVLTLGYHRQGRSLDSSLTGELRELNYSESPNDRKIKDINAVFNYPVTALLSSGFYARYTNIELLDIFRTDKRYTFGGNISYQFSRDLRGLFDIKYRDEDSTLVTQNFSELSVFLSLVYGFGDVSRPTRKGGF